jgi:hypothetical protein
MRFFTIADGIDLGHFTFKGFLEIIPRLQRHCRNYAVCFDNLQFSVFVGQRQASRPAPSQVVQWSLFGWEKIYSDSTAIGPHGVAIPQDSSLKPSPIVNC